LIDFLNTFHEFDGTKKRNVQTIKHFDFAGIALKNSFDDLLIQPSI